MRGNFSQYVRGFTTVKGKIIIVNSGSSLKETLNHEIGHTYDLLHCTNLSCVMAIDNDEYDCGTFLHNM
jgi:hypothetical protein